MSGTWHTVRIGDWGEVRGGRQRSPHLTAGRMRRYLRVANVFDGRIDTTDVHEMLFTDEEFATYALKPGDILLNEGQSSELVGRSAIYEGPADVYAFQNTLVRFRAGPNCDPVFAHEVFRGLWHDGVFERISKKTTSIAHLGVNRFADLTVRVPDLESQRRIATMLRLFGRSAQSVAALLVAKRAFKRALLHELLTGRRRFQEFATSGWKTSSLGDLFTERNEVGAEAQLLLSVTGDRGVIPRHELDRRDTSSADKSKYKRVLPGDVAYNTMRMWQGVSGIARHSGIVSPAYTVLVARGPLTPEYAKHLFKHPQLIHTFWRYSQGLVDDTLSLKFHNFVRIPVNYPVSVEEQGRISQVLDAMDREISLLVELCDAYEAQKRVLMHRILSGHLSLPAPAAASELAHA